MKISPMTYAVTIFGTMIVTMMLTTGLFHNVYDWEQITANNKRLAELEPKAQVYESMTDFNVGVWCGLAVQYDWLEDDDKLKIEEIVESGIHEQGNN